MGRACAYFVCLRAARPTYIASYILRNLNISVPDLFGTLGLIETLFGVLSLRRQAHNYPKPRRIAVDTITIHRARHMQSRRNVGHRRGHIVSKFKIDLYCLFSVPYWAMSDIFGNTRCTPFLIGLCSFRERLPWATAWPIIPMPSIYVLLDCRRPQMPGNNTIVGIMKKCWWN